MKSYDVGSPYTGAASIDYRNKVFDVTDVAIGRAKPGLWCSSRFSVIAGRTRRKFLRCPNGPQVECDGVNSGLSADRGFQRPAT
jgi:hypothetical protein